MHPRGLRLLGGGFRTVLWAVVALLLAGCHDHPERKIQLSIGASPHGNVDFVPEVSLAQYVEIPGSASELTLSFANYAASCDAFVPPSAGQVLLTVVVVTPHGPTKAVAYPWAGHRAHGGTVEQPLHRYALPSVRIGAHSYRIEPGGGIVIRSLSLRPGGEVQGLLGFDFPGTAEHPASRIGGAFAARLCQFSGKNDE